VSRLVQGRSNSRPLAPRELDAMFLLLVVAGNETTRSALALGIQAFAEHPDQWDRARAVGLDGLPAVVEEVLRFTTLLHHFRRTATRDVELRGRQIAAQDKVVVWFTAANRDEEVFDEPDQFDVTRHPNPHVAFGRGGPHRCIGEHLARLEIRVAIEELLRRTERIEVTGKPERVRSNFTNSLKSLPVRVVGARSSSRRERAKPTGRPDQR
jgi:cytochrome P450